MQLNEYVNKLHIGQRTPFYLKLSLLTDRADVSVRAWARGTREVPVNLWTVIEQATDNHVTRHDLLKRRSSLKVLQKSEIAINPAD